MSCWHIFITGMGCHTLDVADAMVFSSSHAVQMVEIMELKPASQSSHTSVSKRGKQVFKKVETIVQI